MSRLIRQFRETGRIADRRGPPVRPFARRYTDSDVRLLAEIDALHGTLSGPATRKLCERANMLFGDLRYERLAAISIAHLYNLRGAKAYRRQRGAVDKTRPTKILIGERHPHRAGSARSGRVDGYTPCADGVVEMADGERGQAFVVGLVVDQELAFQDLLGGGSVQGVMQCIGQGQQADILARIVPRKRCRA